MRERLSKKGEDKNGLDLGNKEKKAIFPLNVHYSYSYFVMHTKLKLPWPYGTS